MPELSEEQAMNQFFSMSAGPWEYPKGSRRCNQMHHRMFHHLALPVLYQWILISGHAKTSHSSISSLHGSFSWSLFFWKWWHSHITSWCVAGNLQWGIGLLRGYRQWDHCAGSWKIWGLKRQLGLMAFISNPNPTFVVPKSGHGRKGTCHDMSTFRWFPQPWCRGPQVLTNAHMDYRYPPRNCSTRGNFLFWSILHTMYGYGRPGRFSQFRISWDILGFLGILHAQVVQGQGPLPDATAESVFRPTQLGIWTWGDWMVIEDLDHYKRWLWWFKRLTSINNGDWMVIMVI